MRIILGIQEAHDASAALMVNGTIVAAAQEERFTGLKGDYGFPINAVLHCLRTAGIKSDQIDEVALASHNWNPVLTKLKRNANFTVNDWVKEQRDYWYPRLFENSAVCYYDLYKDRHDFAFDDTYPMDHLLKGYMDPEEMEQMALIRLQTITSKLGVPQNRVRTITHEDCHTFYSYFGGPLRGKVLALTAEGIGDYSNGTVSEFSEMGRLELARTSENHLGHIYQYITLLLGMKPCQHEYKVMGLAPYANPKEVDTSFEIFERILKVKDLNIIYDQKPRDLYFHFRDALEGHRFDGIAGGLQKFVEFILTTWFSRCVETTGLDRVTFSGGVAQNIKACKAVAALDAVQDFYVCPAAGDTSLSIGACYYAMWRHLNGRGLPTDVIRPLTNIYLGPEFTDDEIALFCKEEGLNAGRTMVRGVGPDDIASWLVAGKIVGRCSGRMEFGLRALGNRSILADPRHPNTVRRINNAIKFRDFWMPFTPTILAEREGDYLVNPKGLKSPYMTLAFDSTEMARSDLPAALHPADLTARPQLLRREDNDGYYEIIKEFERLTGVGAVLNTSFNLHGRPIVLGPREALLTFQNSDLDVLVLGDFALLR